LPRKRSRVRREASTPAVPRTVKPVLLSSLRNRANRETTTTRKRTRTAAVIGAALLVLSGCAGTAPAESSSNDDEQTSAVQELVEAAKQEGSLTYYSASVDEMNKALTDAFTAKYGIPVQTLRIATGGLLERFGSEQDAGVAAADVLEVADQVVFGEK